MRNTMLRYNKKGSRMRKINIILFVMLLTGSSAMAMSAKVEKPELVHGTTLGKYKKPGAPVDIDYTTQHIQAGDESSVNIVLLTPEKQGSMQVQIKLDRGLTSVGSFDQMKQFNLDGSNRYPLHFKVIASSDGVYYIRLLVNMESKGFRAFAVPVYVGNGSVKLKRKPLQKSKSGENIVVSPAQEKIIQH